MSMKPYYTTNALVNSIKLRIMFPTSQSSLTYADVLTMVNEEMQLSAVPAVKALHDEFFVYKNPPMPLVNGISRYPIPNRALGGAIRDLNWSDTSGNFFKMSRIAPEQKSFYQQNVGSNQAIGKYYIEGNEIIITPQVTAGATGSLNFFIYLRPNYLVRDDRAAIIQSFQKAIVVSDNAQIFTGDQIVITTGNQSSTPVVTYLTAVTGSPSSGEFQIGATAGLTAANISTALNALGLENATSTVSSSIATISYTDITTTFVITSSGLTVDNNYIYIQFDQLPSTYTDVDTDITEPMYVTNTLVDFLQTNPGHRTYTYDIKLRQILPGNVGKFKLTDLQTWLNNSSGGPMGFVSVQVGDYICLANECIIPQIPPELHSKLAEMVAARILMAIGDKEGLAVSMGKLAEMDKQQAALIGQRIDSSVPKVFNQFSLLRLQKRGRRRI